MSSNYFFNRSMTCDLTALNAMTRRTPSTARTVGAKQAGISTKIQASRRLCFRSVHREQARSLIKRILINPMKLSAREEKRRGIGMLEFGPDLLAVQISFHHEHSGLALLVGEFRLP